MRTNGHDSKRDENPPEACRIKVRGRMDGSWSEWFDGFAIVPQDDGTTLLTGEVRDDAALHGLLKKVRDLNLPLVSVHVGESAEG